MTNVVIRDGYNIPKLIYDGSLTATSVAIGDAEDFKILRDQVSRSGIFVIKKSDPTQAESYIFANVDTPTSILGYRIYTHASGMQVLFISISNPSNRPDEMVYTGTNKTFAVAT